MKTRTLIAPTSPWLLLALGLLSGVAIPGRLPAEQLEVGVRAKVMNPYPVENIEPGQEGGEHGKIYSIVAVKRVPSEQALVRAVNVGSLRRLTGLFLDANGFRESGYTEKAEVLITVAYGRGYPQNPYLLDTGGTDPWMKGGSGASINGKINEHIDFKSVPITGGSRQLMTEMTNGYQAKLQKAEAEKLLIQVTAWENTPAGTGRGRELWSTTMVVDDPDHRDLNVIGGKMLEAGAAYFGRAGKEAETEIHQTLPEGRVELGVPHPVAPDQPKNR